MREREGVGGGKKLIMILIQISIKKKLFDRGSCWVPHKGLSHPLHPNPPVIGKTRFSTKIKLAQGRGRGVGYLQREGGEEGRREGVGKNILGFWFTFVSKVAYNEGS